MVRRPNLLRRKTSAEAVVRSDKLEERRMELANAALETLSRLGFARTSLREIAQQTAFSHGLFHYYFSDKFDLISCSVRQYKQRCVARYDDIVETASSREALVTGFVEKIGQSMRDDALMHRLWYDLRAQALFESAFREDIVAIDAKLEMMIWRVACRYAELGGVEPNLTSEFLYALFDGLFQKYLLRHLSDDAAAIGDFQAIVREILPLIA